MATDAIFLCYRRKDSRWPAGRLADALRGRFGADRVFFDVDALRPGNWRIQIDAKLDASAALLVVIGPSWLEELGRPNEESDHVRYEVASAIERNKVLIPVVVGGAEIPDRAALPEDIAPLVDQHAYQLGEDSQWQPTVSVLLDALAPLLTAAPDRDISTSRSRESQSSDPTHAQARISTARRPAELRSVFVANNRTNRLLMCSSENGTQWTRDSLVAGGESSKMAPSVAEFCGRLWLAFISDNRARRILLCEAIGANWGSSAPLSDASSKTAPALAAYRDRLYVAFVANDSTQRLIVRSSIDGANWTGGALVGKGEQSKTAPSLTVFQRRLWLAFVANSPASPVVLCHSADGATWTVTASPGDASSRSAAALAVFRDRLYVAFVANDRNQRLVVCSSADGATWTSGDVAGGEQSKTAPSLAVFQDKLWLAFVDNDPANRVLLCSSDDGAQWSVNSQLGDAESKAAPCLVAPSG